MNTRTAIATLALFLAAGASHAALAQDQEGHGPHGEHQPHEGGGPKGVPGGPQHAPPQAPPHAAPQAQGAPRQASDRGPGQAQPAPQFHRSDRGPAPGQARVEGPRGEVYGGDRGGYRGVNGQGGARQPDRGPGGYRDDQRGPPRADSRWDQRRDGADNRHWERGRYPPVYQSDRRFRISPYRYPQGYYARSWGFGDFLPRGWFGSDYLLGDFYAYGLPYPPPGFEWVRVGPDALLVDRYTGRVVQVVRYIFW